MGGMVLHSIGGSPGAPHPNMGCGDFFLRPIFGMRHQQVASMRAALELAGVVAFAASAAQQVLVRGDGSRQDSPGWLNGAQVPAT